MSVFSHSDKQKFRQSNYMIIIGCGRLGANLANTFSEEGKDVLVIDEDADACRRLSPSFSGMFRHGDALDVDLLNEIGIQEADVLICVTNNDNTNIMISQMAKEHFQVPHVISRLYDPDRRSVYEELGIGNICPSLLSANAIDHLLKSQKQEATA